MLKLQKGLLKNTSRKIDIDILVILFAYAGPIISIVLFIFNQNAESGQMAIAYIIVAVGSFFLIIRHVNIRIPFSIIPIIFFMLYVTTLLFISQKIYGRSNPLFVSEQKAFLAMEGCIILLALNIIWGRKTEVNLTVVFIFDVVLSLVSFFALTKGNSKTTGGLVADTSGFLYQNIAYYSAYCLGINMYLIAEHKTGNKVQKKYSCFLFTLSILQLFTCFMSGGRGGSVLAMAFLLYGLFNIYGKRKAYKVVLLSSLFVFAVVVLFPNVMSRIGLETSGFSRFLSLFSKDATNNLSDQGRFALQKQAIDAFIRHPVLGNGIGSVFYLMDSYSHNMFTDILAETGIVGLIIVITIIGYTIKKAIALYHFGSLYRFLTIILISGLSLNMFSGYFWTNQHIWLPVFVFLLSPNVDREYIKKTREIRGIVNGSNMITLTFISTNQRIPDEK